MYVKLDKYHDWIHVCGKRKHMARNNHIDKSISKAKKSWLIIFIVHNVRGTIKENMLLHSISMNLTLLISDSGLI